MKKKMLKTEKNQEFYVSGHSDQKGIWFQLTRLRDNRGFEKEENVHRIDSIFSFPRAYACITEDGSIKVNPVNIQDIRNEVKKHLEEVRKSSKKLRIGLIIIAALIFITAWFIVPIFDYYSFLAVSLFIITLGLIIEPEILYYLIKRALGDKDILQHCRFHAAEHAVINAYYDLKRVPTLEEIKNYSNFSLQNCEAVDKFKRIWVPVGIGICRLLPGVWCYLLAFVVYLVFTHWWASKRNFYFTEFFCISNPTDFEYDAAIKGLTVAVEEMEKKLKKF